MRKFIASVILMMCSLSVILLYQSLNFTHNKEQNDSRLSNNKTLGACYTPACIEAASAILNNMDSTVDPCDDFYQYSCGNWIKTRSVPNDEIRISHYTLLGKAVVDRLHKLLERETTNNDEKQKKNSVATKMRTFYESCIRTDSIISKQGALEALFGVEHELEKWEKCLEMSLIYFGNPLSSLYVKNYLSFGGKKVLENIVPYMRETILDYISESTWMERETKQLAEKQITTCKFNIGYSDEYLPDMSTLDELYEDLTMNISDFNENIMQLNNKSNAIANITIQTNTMKVLRIEPYYMSEDNSINIGATFLQSIYIHDDRPNYLNFGSAGVVIGHELTHSLSENIFAQINSNHSTTQRILLELLANNKLFQQVRRCFIDKFNGFLEPITDTYLNGSHTFMENIADSVGFESAFGAYDNWTIINKQEPCLPGLTNHTSQQLFWMSAGNTFCVKYEATHNTYLKLRKIITENVHSPGRFRLNGALSNIEAFSRSFNCKLGSAMNPSNKCLVWS